MEKEVEISRVKEELTRVRVQHKMELEECNTMKCRLQEEHNKLQFNSAQQSNLEQQEHCRIVNQLEKENENIEATYQKRLGMLLVVLYLDCIRCGLS